MRNLPTSVATTIFCVHENGTDDPVKRRVPMVSGSILMFKPSNDFDYYWRRVLGRVVEADADGFVVTEVRVRMKYD